MVGVAAHRGSVLSASLGLVLLVGVALLPDLTPEGLTPVIGQTTLRARLVGELGTDVNGQRLVTALVLDGDRAGERIEVQVQDLGAAGSQGTDRGDAYALGDEVVVTEFSGPAGGFAVVAEPWRLPLLGLLALAFGSVVVIVGGIRGIRSLVALALTLAVVVKVVVPLLLAGWSPVVLAVGAGAAVITATLLITEGPGRVTLSAVIGTLAALALTAGMAAVFTQAAEFTALQGNEEISFLIPLIGASVDLNGILLAGVVLGALGVLDDVTVTQATTVEQLRAAAPTAARRVIIAGAMRVGRSHIAATVNTLVLAYLGASLPILLLFAVSGQQPAFVINGELLAVEVIRSLAGGIGIAAAVPLTTMVAAFLLVPADAGTSPP